MMSLHWQPYKLCRPTADVGTKTVISQVLHNCERLSPKTEMGRFYIIRYPYLYFDPHELLFTSAVGAQ